MYMALGPPGAPALLLLLLLCGGGVCCWGVLPGPQALCPLLPPPLCRCRLPPHTCASAISASWASSSSPFRPPARPPSTPRFLDRRPSALAAANSVCGGRGGTRKG